MKTQRNRRNYCVPLFPLVLVLIWLLTSCCDTTDNEEQELVQEKSGKMVIWSSRVTITGQANGGSVSIGLVGEEEERLVTVETTAGETAAQVASKLKDASAGSELEPDGVTIKIFNSQPGMIYLRTTDSGIGTVGAIANLTAQTNKAGTKVTLTWSLPDPAPNRLYVFRNYSLYAILPGTTNSHVDTLDGPMGELAMEVNKMSYSIVCGDAPDEEGIDCRFSDVVEVDTESPEVMEGDVFKIIIEILLDGDKGEPYSEELWKESGVNPVSWSIEAGSLPPGLTLSADGMITGTPTEVGMSTFTVKVTDTVGASATKSFSITIVE